MEEDSYKYISLSDSELSMVDEGIYKNIPTAEVDIDTSPEYSPTTEPISFSSSIENYLPSQSSNPIQNQIDEAPLTLPIEYLSAARADMAPERRAASRARIPASRASFAVCSAREASNNSCSTRSRNQETVGVCARLAREHFLSLLEYAHVFANCS